MEDNSPASKDARGLPDKGVGVPGNPLNDMVMLLPCITGSVLHRGTGAPCRPKTETASNASMCLSCVLWPLARASHADRRPGMDKP